MSNSNNNTNSNAKAFEELQEALNVSGESYQFLEKLASAMEQYSKILGMPLRIVFAPDCDLQLKDMPPDVQIKALDAVGCILNTKNNLIDQMISSLQDAQFEILKAKLHKDLDKMGKKDQK